MEANYIIHQPINNRPVKEFLCTCKKLITTKDRSTFKNVGAEYDMKSSPKAAIIECTKCKQRHRVYFR